MKKSESSVAEKEKQTGAAERSAVPGTGTQRSPAPPCGAGPQLLAQKLVVMGQKAAADFVGVKTKTIQRWDKEAEEQVPPVMHYFVENRRYYYYKNFLDELKKKEGVGTNAHRLREQQANAGIKEKRDLLLDIELKREQGKWISREEDERRHVQQITAVRKGHQRFSRELEPFLKPYLRDPKDWPAIKAIMDNKLRNIDRRFADGLKS
ncbi:MAG: hypothetical protein ABII09_03655 [Planctomycetota bacterium]